MLALRSFVLGCIAFCFGAVTINAQPVDGGHARVELISERALAVPGETVWLGLSFEMDPGWHIYWTNPGDAGLPPSITWSDTSHVPLENISDFQWPAPKLLPIVPGQLMDYGYSGAVVLPFRMTLPAASDEPVALAASVDYLICQDTCVPEAVELTFLQSVGAGQLPDMVGAEAIQAALSTVPLEFTGQANLSAAGEAWTLSIAGEQVAGTQGEARFFPYASEIKHAADQPASFGDNGLQLILTPAQANAPVPETLAGIVAIGERVVDIAASPGAPLAGTSGTPGVTSVPANASSLPLLLGLALIGGLILNLMPCVLPVLSIKAMGLVSATAHGNAAQARQHGLWYAAGVLVCFGGLAAAILSVRAATGVAIWGFWLQNPILVTALILVVFLIGLWLLGMFELGTSIQGVGSGLAAKQGNAGAFFTGVLAAIVGAPCTGPFLGAALGAVMTQPAANVILVLLTMGLGMALPFLVLSFSPGLQRFIPKPGAWMETLKQVFAFPMFLTAAWLLSVLGALSGYRAAAFVVAGAALIAFGVWALKSADRGARAILLSVLGLAVILPVFGIMTANSVSEGLLASLWLLGLIAAFIAIARLSAQRTGQLAKGLAGLTIATGLLWPLAQARTASTAEVPAAAYSASYETEPWSPERVAELAADGRAIFVDFTAEWCVTCQANKLQTLQTKPVIEAFEAANVAFLVADFTTNDKTIALEIQKHNRAGVPLYLWYAPGSATPDVLPELLSIDLVTGLVAGTS
ncbi:MAG: protein-disulfide reductase DsbD domain-containing protein [Pseudomonadota bacterium]